MDEITKRSLEAIDRLIAEKKVRSVRQLASAVQLNPSQISEARAGKRGIPEKYADALQNVYNVNKDYILFGRGDIFMLAHHGSKDNQANTVLIGDIQHEESDSPFIDLGNGQFIMIVPLVPVKAQAGYIAHYNDENYVEEHFVKHSFAVSRVYRGRYMAFIVDGDSMDNGIAGEAILEGSTVTGREIKREHWRNKFHLHRYKDYIVVHKEGIFTKRIIHHDTERGVITCHSLNPDKDRYPDFDLNLDDCLQILNIVNVTQAR